MFGLGVDKVSDSCCGSPASGIAAMHIHGGAIVGGTVRVLCAPQFFRWVGMLGCQPVEHLAHIVGEQLTDAPQEIRYFLPALFSGLGISLPTYVKLQRQRR